MRYLQKTGILAFGVLLFMGVLAVSANAQRRGHRPVIVRSHVYWRDPFWHRGYWGDPLLRNPAFSERNWRYYDREAVRDAKNKLIKDREKFYADGILTDTEREQLNKDQVKYDDARDRLRLDR